MIHIHQLLSYYSHLFFQIQLKYQKYVADTTHISAITESKEFSVVYLGLVLGITDVHIETSFYFSTNAT